MLSSVQVERIPHTETMTNHVTDKQQCPACAKLGKDNGHDNLAIYSDGSSYCFSCGYSNRSNRISQILSTQSTTSTAIVLPSDASEELPTSAWDFLKRYGISARDATLNSILYSKYYNRIIFPYIHRGKLVGWQGRSLSSDKTKPKWLTKGLSGSYTHKLGNVNGNVVVLTEDIISAIRVSNQSRLCAVPLFNSHVSTKRLLELEKDHCIVQIWLDKDKAKESMQFAKNARDIGICAVSIITDLDPKEYTEEQIKDLTSYG